MLWGVFNKTPDTTKAIDGVLIVYNRQSTIDTLNRFYTECLQSQDLPLLIKVSNMETAVMTISFNLTWRVFDQWKISWLAMTKMPPIIVSDITINLISTTDNSKVSYNIYQLNGLTPHLIKVLKRLSKYVDENLRGLDVMSNRTTKHDICEYCLCYGGVQLTHVNF